MLPFDATILASDSQNPTAAEMPLYAVLKDGEFTLLDVRDTPCYTFTPAGRAEVLDHYHTPEWLMDVLAKRGIDTAWLDEVESC